MLFFLKTLTTEEIKQLGGGAEPLRAIKFAMTMIDVICTVIPILVIVMTTVSFTKNVIANNGDDMKKELLLVVKRILTCVAIFFVPTFVSIAMSVLGNLGIDYSTCIKVSKEKDLSKYEIEVTIPENKENQNFGSDSKKIVAPDSGDKKDDANKQASSDTKTTNKKNIFIGDSRTCGMKISVKSNKNDQWICKVSSGYDWYSKTAIAELDEIIKNNKGTNYNIIINMGVNDLNNAPLYKSSYESLAKKYSSHKIVIVSVNPVTDSKSKFAKNADIKTFNKTIAKIDNTTYCNVYSKIKNSYETDAEGIHYDNTTYKSIYNYIKKCL